MIMASTKVAALEMIGSQILDILKVETNRL